jgi:RNA methyltransferase, TrmH family
MEVITSRKNPLVLLARRVAEGDVTERDRMLLDGLHLVEDARAAGVPISSVAISSRALAGSSGRERHLAAVLANVGVRVVQVSDPVLQAMSPAATPSGVIALARRPSREVGELLPPRVASPLLAVAIDVQDPGNLGATMRVAEAAGASGLIACGTSADPFGWKTLRGSMGSALRLPIVRERDALALIGRLKAHGLRIVATTPGAGMSFDRYAWTGPHALLVGNEGAGLAPEVLAEADRQVAIPMEPPVESLNVSVSVALILYEARRQRLARGEARPAKA